jgi:heme A synthase
VSESAIGKVIATVTSKIVRGAPVRLTLNSTTNDLVTFPNAGWPVCSGESQQVSQVPKISRSWLISRKPYCSATAFAHRSTAGPETSTVRPQTRQTR